jgi:hypothetical protein
VALSKAVSCRSDWGDQCEATAFAVRRETGLEHLQRLPVEVMKRFFWIAGIAILALAGFTAGLGFMAPRLGVLACPQCFGFHEIGDGEYVNRAQDAAGDQNVRAVVESGRIRVQTFFGDLTADPRIFVCVNEACFRQLEGQKGQSKAVSWLDQEIVVSPRGLSPVILAHELTLTELHHRLPPSLNSGEHIPVWFEEGLATYVSKDPRFLSHTANQEHCVTEDTGERLPETLPDWWSSASVAPLPLYGKAACRVGRWIDSRGGPHAVTVLIALIKRGVSFENAYEKLRRVSADSSAKGRIEARP